MEIKKKSDVQLILFSEFQLSEFEIAVYNIQIFSIFDSLVNK